MQPHEAVGACSSLAVGKTCEAANVIEREMGLHLPDIGLKTCQASQRLTMTVLIPALECPPGRARKRLVGRGRKWLLRPVDAD
jgi:hypothetical protein